MKTKMMSILFVLLLCGGFYSQKTYAQFIVNDPSHTLLNSIQWYENVKKWSAQIQEMADAREIREGLQKINQLKDLQSLVELAELLDDVACLSQDYRFYMNLGNKYNCLKFLNFQQVTVNLNLSMDLLFKVSTVSSFFSMNSEGRVSFISQVRESLEAASAQMKAFNETVRLGVNQEAINSYTKKIYFNGKLTAYNRYVN